MALSRVHTSTKAQELDMRLKKPLFLQIPPLRQTVTIYFKKYLLN